MKLFALAGLITFILGLFLATSHITSNLNEKYLVFVNTHILFGLLGFAFLLIMGVSFQVIPMFYVALDFPKFIQHKVPIILFITLFISFFFFYFEIKFFIFKIYICSYDFKFCLFCFEIFKQ